MQLEFVVADETENQFEGVVTPYDDPLDGILPYKPDDDQLALWIAQQWRGKAIYLYGDWYVYEGGAWRKRATQQVKQGVRHILRQARSRGVTIKAGLINSIAELLQSDLYVSDDTYMTMTEDHRRYICLKNGLYNVDAYRLEPHNPDLFFLNQLDIEFDPQAQCPVFERYLASSLVKPDGTTDFELMSLVQEAMGYTLTSRTDMKASFWLVGKPNSGKSTLIALLRGLMGHFHATIDLTQLATNRFLLAGIVGKRIITFTEGSEGAMLPDALYKALVGGTDEIYADVKNKPGIAFKPEAKLWWAMNGAPRVQDRSGATLNRLKLILFNHSIPQSQQIGGLDGLLHKERAGIFNWALDGLIRLYERGKFTEPEQSHQWLENYRYQNDTEAVYFSERLVRDPDARIQASELHDDYAQWTKRFGFATRNITQVAREWERLGLVRTEINGRRFWKGAKFQQ